MHPKVLLERCAQLLAQTLNFEHPADAVAQRFFREHRELGPRERQVVSDTVYAVLREKPRLEYLLSAYPFPAAPTERADTKRRATRGGHGKPTEPPKAAMLALALLAFKGSDDQLEAATDEGLRTWRQTCLATPVQTMPAPAQHLLPEWLAARLQAQLGDGFNDLASALSDTAPLDLRVNLLKTKRPAVLAELQAAGVHATPTAYSPWGIRVQGKPALNKTPLYLQGAFEVQDEGSQLLALLLDAKRNEMVADFCAGAGGKTLAIGAGMRNTGRLYALDTSAHRLEGLQPRLQRSGLTCVHPMAIAHESDPRLDRMLGKMDRVLVDAPCSGLGTLRRSPDLKWRQTARTVSELAALQARILNSAARLVKPGGRLVYATCSVLEEENEDVAQAFTQTHRDFVPVPVGELLDRAGIQPHESLVSNHFLRLWPHLHGSDGFFAAVWQRKD